MAAWQGIAKALACGALVATLGACVTRGSDMPRGLTAHTPPMKERVNGAVVWRKPGLDTSGYNRVMITPVQIYDAPDADYGSATAQDKQALAEFMEAEFTRVLGERIPLTGVPTPGTLGLRLTLAGMSGNVPLASTAASVMPVGIVKNMVTGGQSAILSGSVTLKGEVFDAQTGELLAAFVTSRTPPSLDFRATVSDTAARQAAVTEAAKDLRDAMIKSRQKH